MSAPGKPRDAPDRAGENEPENEEVLVQSCAANASCRSFTEPKGDQSNARSW
jgi:hypothetical protein